MIYVILLFVLICWVAFTTYEDIKIHGVLSFSILARLLFVVIYVVSGLCHLIFTNNFYRGFFDVSLARVDYNPIVILSLYISYYFLRYGQSVSFRVRNFNLQRVVPDSYWLYSLLFLLIGFFASYKLASSIDVSTIERARELPPGVAKFIFLSQWFIWGVTMFFIRVSDCFDDKDSPMLMAIFGLCVFLIAASLAWTGGRSIVVLLTLPLFWLYSRLSLRNFSIATIISSVAFLLYVVVVTSIRKEGYSIESTNLSEILDWEFGRYSMVAFSFDFLSQDGYLWGATYLDAMLRVVMVPIYFMGIGADFLGSLDGATVSYVGKFILGDSSKTYIVPGALSEAIMNFGLFGAVFIPFFLGVVLRFVDDLIRNAAGDKFLIVFYSYLGAVLTLNYLSGTFLSALNYIFYTGLPLIFLFIIHALLSRGR